MAGWQGRASPQVRRRRDRKRTVLEEQQRNIREEQAAVATCLRAAQEQPKVTQCTIGVWSPFFYIYFLFIWLLSFFRPFYAKLGD